MSITKTREVFSLPNVHYADNDNTSLRVGLTYNFGKHKAKRTDVNINNSEMNRLPDIKK